MMDIIMREIKELNTTLKWHTKMLWAIIFILGFTVSFMVVKEMQFNSRVRDLVSDTIETTPFEIYENVEENNTEVGQ